MKLSLFSSPALHAGAVVGLVVALFGGAPLRAEDWPHWRGMASDGTSGEKGWKEDWNANDLKTVWKTNVGIGFSAVSVSNGRLVTAGHAADQDTVFCFDAASGKLLWKHSYPAELGDKYYEGGTASTPVFEGDRVYASSRWGDVFCFEAASGKVLWQRNLVKDHELPVPSWGFAGSPRVFGNLLLLNIGEAGVALEKSSGKTVWQSAGKEAGYSTPLPVKLQGEQLALFSSGQAYIAVEPGTGKEKWRMRWVTQYGVNAADPVVVSNQVLVSSGYGKGAALVEPGSDKTPKVLWQKKTLRTQMNSPVYWRGHVYGVDGDTTDKARLKCIEISSGEEKWVEPGIGSGGLIIADGRLIILTGGGELMIAPAEPTGFKPTTRVQVLGGKCWTAPVLANGVVYCRNSRGDLAALDLRAR